MDNFQAVNPGGGRAFPSRWWAMGPDFTGCPRGRRCLVGAWSEGQRLGLSPPRGGSGGGPLAGRGQALFFQSAGG